jgi:hypothetical protein
VFLDEREGGRGRAVASSWPVDEIQPFDRAAIFPETMARGDERAWPGSPDAIRADTAPVDAQQPDAASRCQERWKNDVSERPGHRDSGQRRAPAARRGRATFNERRFPTGGSGESIRAARV